MNLERIFNTEVGNTLTKYPSILTYHKMDNKGLLLDELSFELPKNEKFYITEKIDGANARIIILGDDYVIGSREDWLYAKGDRCTSVSIRNYMGYLKKVAEDIINANFFPKIKYTVSMGNYSVQELRNLGEIIQTVVIPLVFEYLIYGMKMGIS